MNILIFGPNGSGKGTQGAIVKKKYGMPHIETGVHLQGQHQKGRTWESRPKVTSTGENWCPTASPSR